MPFKKGNNANPLGAGAARMKYGGKDIEQMARIECPNALRVVADILKDEETPKPVRLKAAELIMDRGLGKARQFIDQTNHNELEKLEETELRERIAALQAKLGIVVVSN